MFLYLTSFLHVSAFVSPAELQRSKSNEISPEKKDTVQLSIVVSKTVSSESVEPNEEEPKITESSSEDSVTYNVDDKEVST